MFMCSLRAHGGERNCQVSGLLLIWGFPHNMNCSIWGCILGSLYFGKLLLSFFMGKVRWNFSAKLTRQSSRLMGIPRIHVLQSGTSMVQPGSRNHALQNSTQSCGQPLKDSMNRDRGVSCSTRVKKTIFICFKPCSRAAHSTPRACMSLYVSLTCDAPAWKNKHVIVLFQR